MAAATIQVSLSPELHTAVQKRVRSGRYRDASDVFRACLRGLEREESEAAW
ncbi:MAG: type II toxin-antitoxin system ParD family antitoxin [Verrucomicrobiales bacterium]|nr:type II toxin-antitoxin system ParD family antitoxin [Verrucomicrobiales bacterium]